jgi:RNA polymerase sigma-70 factor (ECF subfamily)
VAIIRDPLVFFGSRVSEEAVRDERTILASLYAAHGRRIHRFLRDLLGDVALAADATQETFARATKLVARGGVGEKLGAPWLFGIARNVSLEVRRARMRSGRVIASGAPIPDAEAFDSPESELLGREAALVIDRALEELSHDRRAMLLLRLDHGLAYDDIAVLMGVSLAKVKVEIFRAREVLRASLAAHERGDRQERS